MVWPNAVKLRVRFSFSIWPTSTRMLKARTMVADFSSGSVPTFSVDFRNASWASAGVPKANRYTSAPTLSEARFNRIPDPFANGRAGGFARGATPEVHWHLVHVPCCFVQRPNWTQKGAAKHGWGGKPQSRSPTKMGRIVTKGRPSPPEGSVGGWTWLSAEPTFSYTDVWDPRNSYLRSVAVGGTGVFCRSSHEDGGSGSVTRTRRG